MLEQNIRPPVRRTASFTNIDKIEEVTKEDEEEEDPTNSKPGNIQPIQTDGKGTRYRNGALKKFKENQLKLKNGTATSKIDVKAYFAFGSIRNTAHDEEFFRVYSQYLDEAIVKLKMQVKEEDEDYGAEGDSGNEDDC